MMQTFYKGMVLSDYERFVEHRIPGFMADLAMALIYADPITMGSGLSPDHTHHKDVARVIISAEIDSDTIEDMRGVVNDMCGAWKNHPEDPRYAGLRSKIWWSTSGGHGMRGIYCGQPVDYKVLFQAAIPEYYEITKGETIQSMLDLYRHLHDDKNLKEDHSHWSDYR